MSTRPTPPVSLMHPVLGKVFERNGKTWKVASVHMAGGTFWAWLVNTANPADQVRLSVAAITGTD